MRTVINVLFISFLLFLSSCNARNEVALEPNSDNNIVVIENSSEIIDAEVSLDGNKLIYLRSSGTEATEIDLLIHSMQVNNQSVLEYFQFKFGLDKEETIALLIDKIYSFNSIDNSHNLRARKPSREEIRDAMLQECNKHIEPIETSCKAAVWIAYWYKELTDKAD